MNQFDIVFILEIANQTYNSCGSKEKLFLSIVPAFESGGDCLVSIYDS